MKGRNAWSQFDQRTVEAHVVRTPIVADVPNDSRTGGAPAVRGGDEVVPIINELMPRYDFPVLPRQRWSM